MSAPRSTRRQLGRVAALIVLAFIAGLAVRGFISARPSTRSTNSTATTATPAASHATPGPQTSADGIPSGFARTDDGARTAAIRYVLAGQRLLEMEPTRVADAVRSMAAAGSADAQVTEAGQQLGALRTTLASGTGATHYLQAALASRVDAFTTERARVSVWSVGVLSRTGIARPQAGWSISTFELVWERGDWRIWSEMITPGPAPALNASATAASAEQLDQALTGFTPWRPQ